MKKIAIVIFSFCVVVSPKAQIVQSLKFSSTENSMLVNGNKFNLNLPTKISFDTGMLTITRGVALTSIVEDWEVIKQESDKSILDSGTGRFVFTLLGKTPSGGEYKGSLIFKIFNGKGEKPAYEVTGMFDSLDGPFSMIFEVYKNKFEIAFSQKNI